MYKVLCVFCNFLYIFLLTLVYQRLKGYTRLLIAIIHITMFIITTPASYIKSHLKSRNKAPTTNLH